MFWKIRKIATKKQKERTFDQIRSVSGVDSGTISSIISGVSLSCCHFYGALIFVFRLHWCSSLHRHNNDALQVQKPTNNIVSVTLSIQTTMILFKYLAEENVNANVFAYKVAADVCYFSPQDSILVPA